jgi:hypothetical protein
MFLQAKALAKLKPSTQDTPSQLAESPKKGKRFHNSTRSVAADGPGVQPAVLPKVSEHQSCLNGFIACCCLDMCCQMSSVEAVCALNKQDRSVLKGQLVCKGGCVDPAQSA